MSSSSSLMMMSRRVGRLNRESSLLFVCDMQQKFRSSIRFFDQILENSRRLVTGCNILNVPVIVTEQYPKGLGETVPELKAAFLPDQVVTPKTQFSMCLPDVMHRIKDQDHRHSIILCGIEAHVCVQTTALDLMERGYEVHIVSDGISSRSQSDRKIAIERMRGVGAFVTTTESVLLSLVADSSDPSFKLIQSIIMQSVPETGLV